METYCFISVLFFLIQWRASMDLHIYQNYIKPVLRLREDQEC
jgi:hypothetical protein